MVTTYRALVTGGAGFIGSHMVERLLHDGQDVTVIDNYSTGRAENLADLRDDSRLTIYQLDINQFDAIQPLFSGIDWVFHMAALADIVPSIQHPVPYYRSNVDGTLSVLEAARQAKVQRFLYTASSSCYGIPDTYPTPESAEIRPMYPYALTKYLGEQTALHWGQVYRLPVVSLRLFNVYGPRSRTSGTYGAVFGVFLAQKIANKPLTIVGDGTQTRDFTFVTDVVDAFYTAAQAVVTNRIYNVGSGNTYSVSQLAALLGGEITNIPKPPRGTDLTLSDITPIQIVLRWEF